MEQDPVNFITKKGYQYLKNSRTALAQYINCNPEDVVCVTNPSYAVNIIAKGFPLAPGDEVLTTNIEYGACDKTWKYYCDQKGATYVQLEVTLPIASKESFVESFVRSINANTKLIFISHITSATALRLPVEEICAIARERGIPTFVDGAHAPAHVPVDMVYLQASIYTGACHKWMMAPKGASFLYVDKGLQPLFDPLVISWGFQTGLPSTEPFIDYHELQDTRDVAAFCTIPYCIEFMEQYDWDQVSRRNRKLVQDNANVLCELLQSPALAPINDDFIGQMFSCEIKTDNPMQLHDLLYEKYKIQIPIAVQQDKCYIRYSINAFNDQSDLDRLFDALKDMY